MDFAFDIKKTVAASALLCKMEGSDGIDARELLKMLFLADRSALLTWRRPITGDRFVSMPQGPVLERTYDLIKGIVSGSDKLAWDSAFAPRQNHRIKFQSNAVFDLDFLSQREEDALRKAHQIIRKLVSESGGGFIHELHKLLPEWKDPGTGTWTSAPLPAERIFQVAGEDDETIEKISGEIRAVSRARVSLQA